jgi:hypothetical protein
MMVEVMVALADLLTDRSRRDLRLATGPQEALYTVAQLHNWAVDKQTELKWTWVESARVRLQTAS